MRCYSCDLDVGDQGYDRPTGRYYCNTCLEPTHDVQLRRELREANGEGSVSSELLEILDTPNNDDFLSYDEVFNDADEGEEDG